MREPLWLDRSEVEAIHLSQVREHGGSHGLRDEGLLESAVARPKNVWQYEEDPDLPMLAGALAFGLVRNHPFVDGNKRVGFMAAYTFLLLNRLELDAPEPEAVFVIRDVAAGELGEPELVAWLRQRSVPVV
ncbi:MAG TPA: type II toxin-antitoxin system death-on-curing family toxin [Longimicrobiales bacterium]|nr:type II toxin-antitoxin system death-on-curing family toxin [Longimicrobiales bacterium]